MSRHRLQVAIVVAVTALGAGLLAACSGGTSTATPSIAAPAGATTGTPSAAATRSAATSTVVTSTAAGAPAPTRTAPATATTATKATATGPAKPAADGSATTAAAGSGSAGSRTAVLAGRIRPGVEVTGVATWYQGAPGGACLYASGAADTMTVAMNWYDYETAKACGAFVKVTARNGRSVTVRVTNLCPKPCRVHQLDLSETAFAALAEPRTGQLDVTWHLVSPASIGTMSVRYMTGSSRWWCGIQVIGHRNPVARLEVRAGGAWHALTRPEYNYFISPHGSGCGAALRVTDIYGQQLVVPARPVRPDVVQPTGLQFSRR